jgi:hypothetical protein
VVEAVEQPLAMAVLAVLVISLYGA